ncbi:MAG: NAD(P)H-hydrate dehydratase [bacterium]
MPQKHLKKIKRPEDSNKSDYGKVFILAGSIGMTGAAYLCSQVALRTGSGLVTCGIPKSLNQIMEVKFTEAMTLPLFETKDHFLSLKAKNKILEFSKKCDSIAIGPGLGQNKETQKLVKELILKIEKPIILDADGINALNGDIKIFKKRKNRTIITPHPGEMSRLIKKDITHIQLNRENIAKDIAQTTGAVVCLKGHRTVVASSSGEIYINKTGNSGMASGGTGDVLTGIITSFVGQGMDDFSATVAAVYLHGLAGDIAASKKGKFSLIASDIIEYLPDAFKKAGI